MPGVPRPLPADLVSPEHTAIVTQECQNGVVGPGGQFRSLNDEGVAAAIANIARILPVARAAGVRVIHCVVRFRPDGLGANRNAPLFSLGGGGGSSGTGSSVHGAGSEVVPELADDSDIVLARLHGIGPMGGTDLDAVLRNLGMSTIVGVGVSVNVAITNFTMDSVNHGYDFVLPRDAVAGTTDEYAQAVIKNTLSLLSTITTTDDLISAWS